MNGFVPSWGRNFFYDFKAIESEENQNERQIAKNQRDSSFTD